MRGESRRLRRATSADLVIDFDHNATTPLHASVRAAMVELLRRDDLGNPSSVHARGRAAREVVEQARRAVASAVGAESLGVTFTAGGTEANALAVAGAARAARRRGAPDGILTSPLEHPGLLHTVGKLEEQGHAVAYVPVDDRGRIDPARVRGVLEEHPEVGIVTLSAANHELGNRYDVPAFVASVRATRDDVVIHTDAVQALGKTPVEFAGWGVDLLSLSAHKIGGPTGVGALVHHKSVRLEPLVAGHQERGRRGGTEALAPIAGFGVAVGAGLDAVERDRVQAMTTRVRDGVRAAGARIHGDIEHDVGNTVSFAFEGCPGELMCMNLDLDGFAVSTGAACSAGTLEASPVMLALGLTPSRAAEAVRVSLGSSNTMSEVEAFLAALPAIVGRVREAHRSAS